MPMSPEDALLVERMRRLGLACPFCDYDMRGAATARCPECGRQIKERDFQLLKGRQKLPNSKWLVACIVGGCCLTAESPVLMFYAARFLIRATSGLFRLPWATPGIVILLGMAAGTWLTYWIAYRPLRVLTLAFGVRLALSVVLFSAIAVALSLFVYALIEFIKTL